jgi:hypothetical protein
MAPSISSGKNMLFLFLLWISEKTLLARHWINLICTQKRRSDIWHNHIKRKLAVESPNPPIYVSFLLPFCFHSSTRLEFLYKHMLFVLASNITLFLIYTCVPLLQYQINGGLRVHLHSGCHTSCYGLCW